MLNKLSLTIFLRACHLLQRFLSRDPRLFHRPLQLLFQLFYPLLTLYLILPLRQPPVQILWHEVRSGVTEDLHGERSDIFLQLLPICPFLLEKLLFGLEEGLESLKFDRDIEELPVWESYLIKWCENGGELVLNRVELLFFGKSEFLDGDGEVFKG